MEKSKKKRIAWAVVKVLVALAVFAGMFAISISAGICSIVFSGIGYILGWFSKTNKLMSEFLNVVADNLSDLKEGARLVITFNEDTNTISAKKVEKEKKGKKEA